VVYPWRRGPYSSVASVDVEHSQLTHLDASNDALLVLGADDELCGLS